MKRKKDSEESQDADEVHDEAHELDSNVEETFQDEVGNISEIMAPKNP